MSTRAFERLVVGWNRSRLDLASDEDIDWSMSLPRDDEMA
jgi:hypothetical protein